MYVENVNVFCGNGNSKLPQTGGLAENWFYIKAQCGNTIPHAVYPFSLVSVGAYSGGYPCGYGINKANYNGRPGKFAKRLRINGFTHFHHSGTGAIGKYYNYFKVTPFYGDNKEDFIEVKLEEGSPGYYGVVLENDIKAELTAGIDISAHRYTFKKNGAKIAVDFSSCGLIKEAHPQRINSRITDINLFSENNFVFGDIVAEGIKIYAYIIISGGSVETSDGKTVIYNVNENTEVFCGFSLTSASEARKKANRAYSDGFDKIYEDTKLKWEKVLGAIEIEETDKEKRETFYSMLYHSFVKPGILDGEYFDFATLWDQYKTCLPLIFSLFPAETKGIVNSIVKKREKIGHFANCYLLSQHSAAFDMQAAVLTEHILCDAINRGVAEVNTSELFEMMYSDVFRLENKLFIEKGVCDRNTHILDMADGCYYMGCLAERIGEHDRAKKLFTLAKNWINAFDKESGILRSGVEYYEGTAPNYSFRLLHCMDERIALAGGKERFCDLLDNFFGFGAIPAIQQIDPNDIQTMKNGEALGRFEGYNNESDLEAPYAYIYADNHNRMCEVVSEGRKLFSSDRAGIPGNNDNGGLSSCYVFNALGIFPVCGARQMIVGTPMFRSAALNLACGNRFEIVARNYSEKNIYVKKAVFNGKILDRYMITVEDFMNGGILEFYM